MGKMAVLGLYHWVLRGIWGLVPDTATHCNTLQRTATYCNTLQYTAMQSNTLQHTATHCNTLQHTATPCITPQHTATPCNTLQHTATHSNTLQNLNSKRKDLAILQYHFTDLTDSWERCSLFFFFPKLYQRLVETRCLELRRVNSMLLTRLAQVQISRQISGGGHVSTTQSQDKFRKSVCTYVCMHVMPKISSCHMATQISERSLGPL